MKKNIKQKKNVQQKSPDKLDQLKNAISDGGRPAKSVFRAFESLVRQDPEEESWAQKEGRQSKE
jgi:hypothetical protein